MKSRKKYKWEKYTDITAYKEGEYCCGLHEDDQEDGKYL
jgi:hypothetical protein